MLDESVFNLCNYKTEPGSEALVKNSSSDIIWLFSDLFKTQDSATDFCASVTYELQFHIPINA